MREAEKLQNSTINCLNKLNDRFYQKKWGLIKIAKIKELKLSNDFQTGVKGKQVYITGKPLWMVSFA